MQVEISLRIIEIICGLFYFIFGVDGFLHKIPLPQPSPKALNFLKAIDESGYILPTIKILEIFAGLAFIFSFQAPLAWIIMSPIVFHILAYHFLLNKKEIVMPLFVLLVHLALFYKYFETLKILFDR